MVKYSFFIHVDIYQFFEIIPKAFDIYKYNVICQTVCTCFNLLLLFTVYLRGPPLVIVDLSFSRNILVLYTYMKKKVLLQNNFFEIMLVTISVCS